MAGFVVRNDIIFRRQLIMSSSAVGILEWLKRVWLGKKSSGSLVGAGQFPAFDPITKSDEDMLFVAFDRADIGVAMISSDGKVLRVNQALCDALGYSTHELLIKDFFELSQSGEHIDWNRLLQHFAKTTDSCRFERCFEHENGNTVWMNMVVSPIRDNQKRSITYLTQFHDITRHKRTEQIARYSQDLLQGIIEGIPDAVFVKDSIGRYLIINSAGARLIGRPINEIVGKPDSDLLSPEDTRWILSNDDQNSEKDDINVYELAVTVEGQTRAFLFTKTPYRNQAGELSGVVVVAHDITDHQRAAEHLENSRAELRALSARLQSVREEERKRIAREIHDELGQVLTGLKIDVVSLARKMSEASVRNDWEQMRDRTNSIANLISTAIQTVRKISTELRPGLLDAVGLTAAIDWQAKEFEKRTGIKCKLKFSQQNIVLDQNRSIAIFRIFQEILTNVTRHSQATEVSVDIEEKGSELFLEAIDNGRGITASEFSNPKSLGLLGMRERALLLGGEVSIRGAQGKGTTVIVRIPLDKKETEEVHQ